MDGSTGLAAPLDGELDGELIPLLTLISGVSKRLAINLNRLQKQIEKEN